MYFYICIKHFCYRNHSKALQYSFEYKYIIFLILLMKIILSSYKHGLLGYIIGNKLFDTFIFSLSIYIYIYNFNFINKYIQLPKVLTVYTKFTNQITTNESLLQRFNLRVYLKVLNICIDSTCTFTLLYNTTNITLLTLYNNIIPIGTRNVCKFYFGCWSSETCDSRIIYTPV